MTVENWPGRGFYRGNKQAAIADAMRLGGTIALYSGPSPMMQEAMVAAAINVGMLDPKPLPPTIAETMAHTGMSRVEAKGKGFTGNQCNICGSMEMQIAGHCEVCRSCGNTTGCS